MKGTKRRGRRVLLILLVVLLLLLCCYCPPPPPSPCSCPPPRRCFRRCPPRCHHCCCHPRCRCRCRCRCHCRQQLVVVLGFAVGGCSVAAEVQWPQKPDGRTDGIAYSSSWIMDNGPLSCSTSSVADQLQPGDSYEDRCSRNTQFFFSTNNSHLCQCYPC